MKFKIEKWTIADLIELYEKNKLNLNPPYQRNDIWPPVSKKRLIESIQVGYPLPAFFLHEKGKRGFDIVDGQQRTRTFIGYKKKLFPDLAKNYYSADDEKLFKSFEISITIITTDERDEGSIEDFYFRVNKYGVKLNRPEIKRSEFPDSLAQNLIEKIAENDNFLRLGLFTEKATDRLNDLDFVSELLGLLKYGVMEKKTASDNLYKDLKDVDEAAALEERFYSILDRISELNESFPLNASRYRQRNDFYTLFNFLIKHGDEIGPELLKYQYNLLILIGEDIYPTNEKCWPLQEYANNCVSQSNSKRAREARLDFFEQLLINENSKAASTDDTLAEIAGFYGLGPPRLVHVDGPYYLLNIYNLSKIKNQPIFE